jgi:hypothetical protein
MAEARLVGGELPVLMARGRGGGWRVVVFALADAGSFLMLIGSCPSSSSVGPIPAVLGGGSVAFGRVRKDVLFRWRRWMALGTTCQGELDGRSARGGGGRTRGDGYQVLKR